MPILRSVSAYSLTAVDESVFISLAERQNKCKLNLYTLSELSKKQFVFFMSTLFKNQPLNIYWIVLIFRVIMEA